MRTHPVGVYKQRAIITAARAAFRSMLFNEVLFNPSGNPDINSPLVYPITFVVFVDIMIIEQTPLWMCGDPDIPVRKVAVVTVESNVVFNVVDDLLLGFALSHWGVPLYAIVAR